MGSAIVDLKLVNKATNETKHCRKWGSSLAYKKGESRDNALTSARRFLNSRRGAKF
jgi:hypothetical protein